MIVTDQIAKMISKADRKALKILLPDERMAKIDAQSEKELQRLCESELNRRNIVYLHLSFRAREKIGWPDLTFHLPGPNRGAYAIELKTATGKLSDAQNNMLCRMADNGWTAHVCRSFDEFLTVIGREF